MAGQTRIKIGELTQSKVKGKALVSALSSAMKSENEVSGAKKGSSKTGKGKKSK